jgi:hypothetical protein
MRRREFITLFGGTVATWPLAAPVATQAQPVAKVYRIGYLSNSSAAANPHLFEAFRQGLRELGWVEGQNITIDPRFAEGRSDRLSDLAVELVDFAGESVGWKPLGHRVGVEERSINSLRFCAQHSMKSDGVCVVWHSLFAFRFSLLRRTRVAVLDESRLF